MDQTGPLFQQHLAYQVIEVGTLMQRQITFNQRCFGTLFKDYEVT